MELATVQARVGAVLEMDWRGAAEAVLVAHVQAAAEKGPGTSGDGEETEDEVRAGLLYPCAVLTADCGIDAFLDRTIDNQISRYKE
jgi:hypothetical protein